jgi:hypothetical protein
VSRNPGRSWLTSCPAGVVGGSAASVRNRDEIVDLTTTEKVRGYLGIVQTTADDELARIIGAVSAEIERWCGQPIVAETDNVAWRFTGDNTGSVLVPYFPVVAVSAVSYVSTLGADAVALDAADFGLGIRNTRLIGSGAFWGGYDYTALLTVGYSEVPPDVEQVAIEMVAVRVRDSGIGDQTLKLGKSTLGLASKGESQAGAPSKSTVFTRPDWAERLAPYRVVTI